MTNDSNRRNSVILIVFAILGALIAWLWGGSILGAFMGWMSGGAVGSAVVSLLSNKRATACLFLMSAALLAAAVFGLGRLEVIWIIVFAFAGMMSSAIGSQIEKENLDAG